MPTATRIKNTTPPTTPPTIAPVLLPDLSLLGADVAEVLAVVLVDVDVALVVVDTVVFAYWM